MDSRITKIAKSVTSNYQVTYLGVGGTKSSLNLLNVGSIKADTVFLLCRKGRKDIYIYADSSRSYELRFIALFEDVDIKDTTYGGIPFSRTQSLPFKTPVSTSNITILYFDEPMTSSIDTFERPGHPNSDLFEALLRATISVFMFLVKKNPNRYFSVNCENEGSSYFKYDSKGLWEGATEVLGERQFRIGFECEGLHFAGRRPSENEVTEIVRNCFGRYCSVDNVSGTDSPLAVFLDFDLSLR